MEFNKQQYENNEKLIYKLAFGFLFGALGLFAIAILILRNFDYLESTLGVLTGFGMFASAVIVITGNIRLIRYVFIIRKQDTVVNVWKSAISIAFALTSLLIYWFILLLLALQNFT